MGRISILPRESTFTETETVGVEDASLPLQYMSDYSILALRVDKFEAAQSVLEDEHFQLNGTSAGLDVIVKDIGHLQIIVHLLETHGINVELTDIVAQIYQG